MPISTKGLRRTTLGGIVIGAVLLGITHVVAPVQLQAGEWRDIFRPLAFDNCSAQSALSLETSGGSCLIVSGRALWTYAYSTADGRLPIAQSNVFAGYLEQASFGVTRAVIGYEGYSGWNLDSLLLGGTEFRNDMRVTDAYVQVGDQTRLTAGRRDPRWGSVADLKTMESFWSGDVVQTGQILGSLPMFGWAHNPALGGHVVQIEAEAGNGLTLVGAAEALDTTGTAMAMARYEGTEMDAYAAVMSTGVLGGAEQWSAFNIGAEASVGDTRILAHATGAVSNGPRSTWNARAIVDHAVGFGGVVATGAAFGVTDTFWSCSAWCNPIFGQQVTSAIGLSAYASLSPIVRVEAGGQFGAEHGPALHRDFYSLGARLILTPSETLEVAGELGSIWLAGESPPLGPSWQDTYFDGKLAWKPGGGVQTSLESRHQSNGAYRYVFKAEKRF